MEAEEIIGREVLNAYVLTDPARGGIAQVVFRMEQAVLRISVDAATDEIRLSLSGEEEAVEADAPYLRKPLANQRKRLAWLWRMTNQLGYEDGLQLEFDDRERTNVQVLAEGGQLDVTVFRRN